MCYTYLFMTNVLLRFGVTSLQPATLQGPSNLLEYRILLIWGTTARLHSFLGSLWAKYCVRSNAPAHRRFTLSPKCTKPSLDILRSIFEIIKWKNLATYTSWTEKSWHFCCVTPLLDLFFASGPCHANQSEEFTSN